ncbi:hypothetical protein BJV82DRAFT_663566 [Fennellomyces sp. T-0311]|nr:hypothetical protein BJV82DRAFT_663566 [Fennellomyces sp. T-0311]
MVDLRTLIFWFISLDTTSPAAIMSQCPVIERVTIDDICSTFDQTALQRLRTILPLKFLDFMGVSFDGHDATLVRILTRFPPLEKLIISDTNNTAVLNLFDALQHLRQFKTLKLDLFREMIFDIIMVMTIV